MENVEKTERKWHYCDGFILKIIAIVSMTFDHIAVASSSYGLYGTKYDVMRSIGRLALPLFAFLIVEGVIHTRSFWKYFSRLLSSALIVTVGLILLTNIKEFGYVEVRDFGNIFIDLSMGSLTIYLLRQKRFKKLFALLPLAFVILSFTASHIEETQGILIHWFPYFIRTQYGLFAYALILGFFFAYFAKDVFLSWYSNQSGINMENLEKSEFERTVINVISAMMLVIITLFFHMMKKSIALYYLEMQPYCMISGAFILIYNGKRGYNSKWFQYAGYAYYPVHIMLIALILHLINL